MGIPDVSDLYWQVQRFQLTSASDYFDLCFELIQAANNLSWSTQDIENLEDACMAVGIF